MSKYGKIGAFVLCLFSMLVFMAKVDEAEKKIKT